MDMMYKGLAKGISRESKSGGDMVAEIVAIMMMSRTYSHLAHLKTSSYAAHKALNEFYDEVVDQVDSLAEAAQGQYGKLDIGFMQMKGEVSDPVKGLSQHLDMIKEASANCDEDYLESILQEIEKLYRSAIYKLKELSQCKDTLRYYRVK